MVYMGLLSDLLHMI